MEYALRTFTDDTKLGGMADIPDSCAAVLRDLDRLKNWAEGNLMKLKKMKCKVLCLGSYRPVHQWMLGFARLENSFVQKDHGVLVDKMTVSQQSTLSARKTKSQQYPGMPYEEHWQQVEGCDPSSPLSAGEVTGVSSAGFLSIK